MNNIPAVNPPQEPKITGITSYQFHIDEGTHSKIKELFDIKSRLDSICNRINSVDYPKNFPRDGSAKTENSNNLVPHPTPPDGLVGHLIKINERGIERLNELQDIIDEIRQSIEYIEVHI